MMTVKAVNRITGVSIRALHYYHEIGLLSPARITDAGYRLYDDDALARLWDILLLRRLRFSLDDIATMLNRPADERASMLDAQPHRRP